MYAIHKQAVPPSGLSHTISARLTPSCYQSTSSRSQKRIVRQIVAARNNFLQVFDVLEELDEVVQNGSDTQSNGKQPERQPTARASLHFLCEHRLHGTITGIQRIQTIDTAKDGLDRLLVSFKDAKMSLLEWSSDLYDLIPLSLHTFEKLPYIMQGDLLGYHAILRTEPLSRCAALLLPQDTLAITPFFQDQIELEGAENSSIASLPYAPSFTLELLEINPQLRNVIDFVFLPGFNEPTVAILSQPVQTWSARLENAKDTVQLFLLTLDITSSSPSSTVISSTTSLPYDSFQLTPCPKDLGGVLVTTNNSIIHIDQSGKRTVIAFNAWANIVSDMSKGDLIIDEVISLEGSRALFITSELCLLYLQSGGIRALKIQRDGRTISKLALLPDRFQKKTVPPADVELVRSHLSPKSAHDGTSTQACFVFVASMVGDSELLRIDFRTEVIDETEDLAIKAEYDENGNGDTAMAENMEEEEEDDIDIYGSADAKQAALSAESAARKAANTKLVLGAEKTYILPGYGSIRSAVRGPWDANAPPEIIACTGDAESGGLTIFHRSLLPTNRQRINLDHSTESLWAVRVRSDATANGEHSQQSYKSLLFTSQDRETQIYDVTQDLSEPEYVKTFGKSTLAVGSVLEDSYIVYLLQDKLAVLDSNLKERQAMKLADIGKATSAFIQDPYVLVKFESSPAVLYKAESGSGQLSRQDLPSSLTDGAAASTLFKNVSSSFQPRKRKARPVQTPASARPINSQTGLPMDNDDDIYGEPSPQMPLSAKIKQENDMQEDEVEVDSEEDIWLCSCSSVGHLTITHLGSGETVFSAQDVFTFPTIIEDSTATEPQEDMPEDAVLEQLSLTNVGRNRARPALSLLLEDGTLIVYEAVPDYGYAAYREGTNRTLGLRFIKTLYKNLGAVKARTTAKTNGASESLGPAPRRFIPFENFGGYSGLVLSGETPLWLIAEDHAAFRHFDSTVKPIFGFCTTSSGSCILTTGEETLAGQLSETTDMSRELPFTKVVENRFYTGVAFDKLSQAYVAIASYEAPFEIFDEQGDPINKANQGLLEPTATRSTLELIEPGTWRTVDGFEFRQYETALSIQSVTLETRSTTSGYRDFIAVGTIVSRGEDLSAKGAVYVFEVVQGRPGKQDAAPYRQLRLICMEDLKSAVSNVTSLNGYLLHSVGLKIYGKAFEQDEKLLALAFLDVNMHTTCVRSLKNLLLLGDALNGLNFIAFQEDPYKLMSLGREFHGTPTVTVDFLVLENRSVFVSTDIDGIIRFFEYDPLLAETHGGQRLLPRVEFKTGVEASMSIPFARDFGGDAKQSGVLYLNVDGSLSTITPVRDAVYRRLQLLERQLIRHTHHFGGLNPRAHRTVRNDHVPRPLTKGLLDGDLLSKYSMLSTVKQQQLADPLGSDSDTINYNLKSLKAPW